MRSSRHLAIAAAIASLLFVSASWGQTCSAGGYGTTASGSALSTSAFNVPGAATLLVRVFNYSNSAAPTVTDTGGDSFSLIKSLANGGDNTFLFAASNAAVETSEVVTATIGSGSWSYQAISADGCSGFTLTVDGAIPTWTGAATGTYSLTLTTTQADYVYVTATADCTSDSWTVNSPLTALNQNPQWDTSEFASYGSAQTGLTLSVANSAGGTCGGNGLMFAVPFEVGAPPPAPTCTLSLLGVGPC